MNLAYGLTGNGNVVDKRTKIFIFAVGSDVSIQGAPLVAAVGPFMSLLKIVLFSNSAWVLNPHRIK